MNRVRERRFASETTGKIGNVPESLIPGWLFAVSRMVDQSSFSRSRRFRPRVAWVRYTGPMLPGCLSMPPCQPEAFVGHHPGIRYDSSGFCSTRNLMYLSWVLTFTIRTHMEAVGRHSYLPGLWPSPMRADRNVCPPTSPMSWARRGSSAGQSSEAGASVGKFGLGRDIGKQTPRPKAPIAPFP